MRPPLTEEVIEELKVGDQVLFTGRLLTARDAAHQRLVEALRRGEELPVDLKGQVIYYTGPTPAPPGKVIGSAGPTTSGRMDPYTLPLLVEGLKGMIGKGYRSPEVREALVKFRAVYFVTYGGAGALLSRCIKEVRLVAYPELGPEAIYEFWVEDFPAWVANDIYGGDIYETRE
ncbi:hydro-lyase, Fe-S type, tartrate/fumarate subfamily, beta subunit [Ammonifex degensii KC4]|uniref:Hydro-lyase, Fe-S type, tartrate/fumarate subfamily, beta subunit n=1 Tax=Ammonifex degensii (strain DSM 10501 / KC4) TaxID=429009 RepID=C9RB39_AMMDK|nr:hydro-lyase, Fe-S type, tartrate/fumarate subfamily, beta subunit [Ammonifex degensii KC4]